MQRLTRKEIGDYLNDVADDFVDPAVLPLLTQDEAWEVAPTVASQYETAMSRRSDYQCDLQAHIESGMCRVYAHPNGSFLVGNVQDGVFVVSHFAPKSLRKGFEMMRDIADGEARISFAVPFYLARQALKAGFEWVADTHQVFNGRSCLKHVFCIRRMADSRKDAIADASALFDCGAFCAAIPSEAL